jgi:transcriptional regulator with XRE-family HTH domain
MTTHSDDQAQAINRAIGSRVAWYMKYAGDRRRTQAELGELLDLDQSGISKKLAGARPFYMPELYAIAAWLDRPISDFLPSAHDLAAAPPLPAPRPPRARRRTAAASTGRAAVAADIRQGTGPDTRRYRLPALAA